MQSAEAGTGGWGLFGLAAVGLDALEITLSSAAELCSFLSGPALRLSSCKRFSSSLSRSLTAFANAHLDLPVREKHLGGFSSSL